MTRRLVTLTCGLLLRVFFRRIETTGRERVPREGGVIFVVNHPNALVDPLFLLCLAPRQVSFLAKSTLLRMPVIGWLARSLDTLPVYRQQDAGENTARNAETFAACRRLLAQGGTIAICPEGVSHNEPRLRPLKTGAARIALGAAAGADGNRKLDVQIVPVGLYYTAKTVFRSDALLNFGAPIRVPFVTIEADGEPPRDAVRDLSAHVEAELRSLVINADDERTLDAVTTAERIWSSEDAATEGDSATPTTSLHRTWDLRRRFVEGYESLRESAGDNAIASNLLAENSQGISPSVLDELERRVRRYDRVLRFARVDPHDVTTVERAPSVLLRRFVFQLLLLIVLLPLALPGVITHYPAYRLIGFCAGAFSRGSDDMVATIKMIAALLLFPLTWLLLSVAVWLYAGSAAALLAFALVPVTGYAAMRALEIEERLGEQFRVLRLAQLRRDFFAELVAERRRIGRLLAELASQTPTAA